MKECVRAVTEVLVEPRVDAPSSLVQSKGRSCRNQKTEAHTQTQTQTQTQTHTHTQCTLGDKPAAPIHGCARYLIAAAAASTSSFPLAVLHTLPEPALRAVAEVCARVCACVCVCVFP